MKNSKNCFKCLASKIDSILSNYNYMGGQKAKKIEKRAQKILKAKTKARYGKKSNFQNFFSFLGLIGSRNSCVPVFLVFEDLKAKKAAPMQQHRKYVKLRLKLCKFGLST